MAWFFQIFAITRAAFMRDSAPRREEMTWSFMPAAPAKFATTGHALIRCLQRQRKHAQTATAAKTITPKEQLEMELGQYWQLVHAMQPER
jgi:hypothetical protein